MYSNDRALSGYDRPRSTSSSAPSTSILQKAGSPYRAISSSSVVTDTGMPRSQVTPENPGVAPTAAIQSAERLVTVGVRSLTNRVRGPGAAPTAFSSSSTFG